jgi:hypothetical protein
MSNYSTSTHTNLLTAKRCIQEQPDAERAESAAVKGT